MSSLSQNSRNKRITAVNATCSYLQPDMDKLRQRIPSIPIELLKWKFTSGSLLPAGAPVKLAVLQTTTKVRENGINKRFDFLFHSKYSCLISFL